MSTDALREAWRALDEARVPAWRRWWARLRRARAEGMPFDVGFETATTLLLEELKPYYDAVSAAGGAR